MVIGSQPTIVATWLASQPTVPDFSCGFQFHLSSGHRSRVLRKLCIYWSNSPSIICPMVMTSSLPAFEIRGAAILGEQKPTCQAAFDDPACGHLKARSLCPASLREHGNGSLPICAAGAATPVGLTACKEGTEWRYGAPIYHVVLERFQGCFWLLQETG